ncbi:MAG TPA: prolipoprotein diacylglyceryl transferase [Prevotella sp.]|nr:prolipoprotein diacylglyceryl transferase [Prevotella sp.]
MIHLFNYIVWDPNIIAFHIGHFGVRWYSICWLIGLVLAFFIVKRLYKEQKIKDEYFDPLFIYCFVGILVGCRLGHCLFYQPDYFLSSWDHVVEMVLPFHHMADGSWKYVGYEGLASHGGTLGLMIALYFYYRKTHVNLWVVLDDIAIATPTTACFIRLGNLMNSEIIGKVTDVPWAFIFEQVDQYPRHPGQLYEAIAYAIFFFVGWYIYRKKPQKVGTGFFFGLCLFLIFSARFFIEFTKDIQEPFEAGMALNMGQILSIPFVILGLACMIGGKWMKKIGAKGIENIHIDSNDRPKKK